MGNDDNEIIDGGSLKSVTSEILGRYYDLLHYFISRFFRVPDDALYLTLFITRRCSCLAYIILKIDNLLAEIKDNNIILTNSALSNAVGEIADRIMSGKRTELRLVDDSIGYGRAVVNIIAMLKKGLEAALESRGCPNVKTEVNRFIKDNTTVNIFIKKDTNILYSPADDESPEDKKESDENDFIGEVPLKINVVFNKGKSVSQKIWNDFSERVTRVLVHTDVANAAFVISAGIKNKPVLVDSFWKEIGTNYNENNQTVFLRAFPDVDNPKIIGAIRCFRTFPQIENSNGYRIVPFVFFRGLNENQIEKIEDEIFPLLPDAIDKKIYRETATLRSRSEFITTFISHSLLLEFLNEHTGFKGSDTKDILSNFDDEKIKWTYTFINDGLKGFGRSVINENRLCDRSKWLKEDEVARLIDSVIDKTAFGLEDLPVDCNDESDSTLMKYVIDLCEKVTLEYAANIERHVSDLVNRIIIISSWQSFKCDLDRRFAVYEFMRRLEDELASKTKEKDGVKIQHISQFMIVAVLLQLMDWGVISVVNRDMADDYYGSGGTEHHIVQQMRFCEQALCTYPRKYKNYLKELQEIVDRESVGISGKNAFELLLKYDIAPELEQLIEKKERDTQKTKEEKSELEQLIEKKERDTQKTQEDKAEILEDLKHFVLYFWIARQRTEYWDVFDGNN